MLAIAHQRKCQHNWCDCVKTKCASWQSCASAVSGWTTSDIEINPGGGVAGHRPQSLIGSRDLEKNASHNWTNILTRGTMHPLLGYLANASISRDIPASANANTLQLYIVHTRSSWFTLSTLNKETIIFCEARPTQHLSGLHTCTGHKQIQLASTSFCKHTRTLEAPLERHFRHRDSNPCRSGGSRVS